MDTEEAFLLANELVLAQTGKPLNNVQFALFCGAWQGQPYTEIAEKNAFSEGYVKEVASQLWKLLSEALGQKVSKSNLQAALQRKCKRRSQPGEVLHSEVRDERQGAIADSHLDWGEMPDVSFLCGYDEELATLEQWIIRHRCRMVAVLGMGGIGKTALVARCTQQIKDEFEYVIWRSLNHAPPVEYILADLIKFLSNQQETELPETVGERITRLIHYLRSSRCLLVLDNAESIMRGGDRAGYYREGYGGYGELLKRVGESLHQSCLLLISREKPKEIASLEGKTLPVHSLHLTGLQEADAVQILRAKGLSGSESECRKLILLYAGNPLALMIVSTTINDVFAGNISEFMQQEEVSFGDFRDVLEQQIDRLPELEKEIMHRLAIHGKPVSLSELRTDIVSPVSTSILVESLESLGRRSLIIRESSMFTQPPIVMAYMKQLIERAAR